MSETSDPLPEPVRARVIAYAADALGALPPDHVPGPLKRAALFTPSRRARLAGQQILDQLEGDPEFRAHLGVQAKARQPEVAARLADGGTTVETAALGYLVRPDGWEELLATVLGRTGAAVDDSARAAEEVALLRRRLDAALADQAALKRSAKEAAAAARAENAELRRKLGDARSQARTARAEAARVDAEAAARIARLEAELAAVEGESRRLRSQVVALEGELGRAQRSTRTGRDEATLRARLLLDTLVQAGQGLRQELALPVVSGSPADQVEAHLAESGTRMSSAVGSRALDDPAHVREVLALPQVHLIVDGYNVTRAVWDDTPLESQRARLLRGLAPLAARTGAEITVVFDGTHAESRPLVQAPRGVRVLFSPQEVLADDVIRDLVEAEPAGRPVAVVTSDQEVVRDVVRRPGVRAIGSRALLRLLG
jgi:predicted RNA-binding protein with PIN domain